MLNIKNVSIQPKPDMEPRAATKFEYALKKTIYDPYANIFERPKPI